LKIIYDLCGGLPDSSYLLTNIDPLSLPKKHGVLSIGWGFSKWSPFYNLLFQIKDLSGNYFGISVPDFIGSLLDKYFGPNVSLYFTFTVLGISGVLFVRRILSVIFFELGRKKYRRSKNCHFHKKLISGFRKVDIYFSDQYFGSPFTGGLFRPYICLPSELKRKLHRNEIEAVIDHELTHVDNGDYLTSFFIKSMGDIFWFVPFYRYLSRKISDLREILADRGSIEKGNCPQDLANALIKLKESETYKSYSLNPVYSGLFKNESLLKTRINRLADDSFQKEKRGRFGWNTKIGRPMITFFAIGCVLFSTLGGNYTGKTGILDPPQWIKEVIKSFKN
jgi:hypothetical protein